MASPLRRSTRASRNADPTATTPEPSGISPTPSPTKFDRKRKRGDEPAESVAASNGADEQMPNATSDTSADSEAQTSLPKKSQLPKKLQALLGLPGSSTALRQSASLDVDAAAQRAEELVLTEDDAKKLATIIRALDAAHLLSTTHQSDDKSRSETKDKATDSLCGLEDLLRSGTPLRRIKARLHSIRQPLLADPDVAQHVQVGSSDQAAQSVTANVAKVSSLTLVMGLVDQLAARRRQADPSADPLKGQFLASSVEQRARLLEARNAQKTRALDDSDDDDAEAIKVRPIRLPVDEEPTHRYALHMRLPRGDYFTKAIALDRSQLGKLDAAQADIVQISAQSEAQMRALKRQGLVPTPTLGQRLGKSGPRHRSDSKRATSQQRVRPQPVTFLNYGNYSSFAPSYDSSSASISYAASSALHRSSAQARHALSLSWGEKPFQSQRLPQEDEDDVEVAMTEPPYADGSAAGSGSIATKRKLDSDVDGDIAMSDPQTDEVATLLRSLVGGVNENEVHQSLERLSQDELVTSHLRFNMMLLHRLQEFQWARLRRSYAPKASGRKVSLAAEDEAPSAEEEATAALLLESLSALIALQPRAVDLTSDAVESVVPEASKLRAFSASSGAIDPDLLGDVRDSFWGALDANVVKVNKNGTVSSETPLVLRDDVTIRLTDNSRSKKPVRRTGPGAMQTEDHGHGVLERFAASRTYDHKNDRHDIDPTRAAGAAGEQPNAVQRTNSAPRPGVARDSSRGDMASPAMRPGMPPSVSPQPRHPMHAASMSGPEMSVTPQSQRLVPGPNASFAFASPAEGRLSYAGRPMHPQPSPGHPLGATAPRQG